MLVCIVMRFPKKSIELWSAGAGNPGLYSDRTKSAAKVFCSFLQIRLISLKPVSRNGGNPSRIGQIV